MMNIVNVLLSLVVVGLALQVRMQKIVIKAYEEFVDTLEDIMPEDMLEELVANDERFEIEEDDEQFPVRIYVGVNRLQYACDMLTVADNVISPITEDMLDLYVTELDKDIINKLDTIRNLMRKQTETDDKYYYDLFFETEIALNSLLDEVGR